MYRNLIVGVLTQQAGLLALYRESDHDRGIGLFVMAHLMTSITFFEGSRPPGGCTAVHEQCIAYQRLCVRIVATDMEGRPSPAEMLDEYDASVTRLVASLNELSDLLKSPA